MARLARRPTEERCFLHGAFVTKLSFIKSVHKFIEWFLRTQLEVRIVY